MSPAEAITIERATAFHVNGVLECLGAAFACYQPTYTAAAYQDTVLTKASLLRRLEEMTVLVALNPSGRVVGTIAYKLLDQGWGHLRGMAVLPEFLGRGIADQLLERAEADLADENCSHISLNTTEPLHRAVSFYERHGFRRSGRVRDFFGMPLIEYVKLRE